MSYTSDLTDNEWSILEPLLPHKKLTCPMKWTKRQIINGVLYQLKNGCNWVDLPKDYPPYSTVFWHYKQWRKEQIFEEISAVLHGKIREQAKKNRNGRP